MSSISQNTAFKEGIRPYISLSGYVTNDWISYVEAKMVQYDQNIPRIEGNKENQVYGGREEIWIKLFKERNGKFEE